MQFLKAPLRFFCVTSGYFFLCICSMFRGKEGFPRWVAPGGPCNYLERRVLQPRLQAELQARGRPLGFFLYRC